MTQYEVSKALESDINKLFTYFDRFSTSDGKSYLTKPPTGMSKESLFNMTIEVLKFSSNVKNTFQKLIKKQDDTFEKHEKVLETMYQKISDKIEQSREQIPAKKPSQDMTNIQSLVIENRTFTKESFADVLKNNITKKLENIPVTKSIVNTKGEGILIFPSKTSCEMAKNSLSEVLEVKQSEKKNRKASCLVSKYITLKRKSYVRIRKNCASSFNRRMNHYEMRARTISNSHSSIKIPGTQLLKFLQQLGKSF